jgi:hypothetical protein
MLNIEEMDPDRKLHIDRLKKEIVRLKAYQETRNKDEWDSSHISNNSNIIRGVETELYLVEHHIPYKKYDGAQNSFIINGVIFYPSSNRWKSKKGKAIYYSKGIKDLVERFIFKLHEPVTKTGINKKEFLKKHYGMIFEEL